MIRRFSIGILLIMLSVLAIGCINVTPQLDPGITPAPTATASPESPTPEHTEQPSSSVSDDNTDALGNVIIGSEHFEQYLRFKDIRVYEVYGDTFMDCIVVNSYPNSLVCGISIEFYDEDGQILASAVIQSPTGSYLLTLPNGETHLYATIPTDSVLTDKEFVFVFDDTMSVSPIE